MAMGAEAMTDIVERLQDSVQHLHRKVEELRAENEKLKEEIATCRELRKYDRAEIEQLRTRFKP
jgi:predicted RNase H-like nuclease (RuvC/YqgF family)